MSRRKATVSLQWQVCTTTSGRNSLTCPSYFGFLSMIPAARMPRARVPGRSHRRPSAAGTPGAPGGLRPRPWGSRSGSRPFAFDQARNSATVANAPRGRGDGGRSPRPRPAARSAPVTEIFRRDVDQQATEVLARGRVVGLHRRVSLDRVGCAEVLEHARAPGGPNRDDPEARVFPLALGEQFTEEVAIFAPEVLHQDEPVGGEIDLLAADPVVVEVLDPQAQVSGELPDPVEGPTVEADEADPRRTLGRSSPAASSPRPRSRPSPAGRPPRRGRPFSRMSAWGNHPSSRRRLDMNRTRPPRRRPESRAWMVGWEIVLLRNRTEPSAIPAFAPPGWSLLRQKFVVPLSGAQQSKFASLGGRCFALKNT